MTMRYLDSEIIKQWLRSQASPVTQSCYQRDANRLARPGDSSARFLAIAVPVPSAATKANVAPQEPLVVPSRISRSNSACSYSPARP